MVHAIERISNVRSLCARHIYYLFIYFSSLQCDAPHGGPHGVIRVEYLSFFLLMLLSVDATNDCSHNKVIIMA